MSSTSRTHRPGVRLLALAAGAFCIAATVAGCTAPPEKGRGGGKAIGSTAAPSVSPTPTPSDAAAGDGAAIDPNDPESGSDPSDQQGPDAIPLTAKSRAAAKDVALKAMTAYARPDISETQWYNDLRPYLDDSVAADWQDTDPANVAARKVTEVSIASDSSGNGVYAVVATDAGAYNLVLLNPSGTGPWKVYSISEPD